MTTPTIVVTGATGIIGSAVVALLCESGATVRAMHRNPDNAPPGVQPVRIDELLSIAVVPQESFEVAASGKPDCAAIHSYSSVSCSVARGE